METEDKIEELVWRCVAARLDGAEALVDMTTDEIRRAYNGIGPEWAGEKPRDWLTRHLALFEPAAVIHDVRNEFSDGTRKGFMYANYEFFVNCLTLADAAHPWWSWRRYRAYAAARLVFKFVSGPGGWKAWMECYEKSGKGEH